MGYRLEQLGDAPVYVHPISVRATSGHTQWHRVDMLRLDQNLSTSLMPMGCAMSISLLASIVAEGLRPGGDGRRRMMTYFTPWDEVGSAILHPKTFRGRIRVALYMSVKDLNYARLDTDGRIVTSQVIPFTAISGAWREDPHDCKWERLLHPGESQFVGRSCFMPRSFAHLGGCK